MITRIFVRLCLVVSLLTSILKPHGASAGPNEEVTVRRVLADWQKRYKSIGSIEYIVTGTDTHMHGSCDMMPGPAPKEEHPASDTTLPYRSTFAIDFTRNRYRKDHNFHIWDVGRNAFVTSCCVAVFDGNALQLYQPREGNTSALYTPSAEQPELTLATNESNGFITATQDWPIFLSHGIPKMPYSLAKTKRISEPPILANFSVLSQASPQAEGLVIVRYQPQAGDDYHLLTLDPAKDHAVVRAETRTVVGAQLVAKYSVEHQQIGAAWLPRRWTADCYSWAKPDVLAKAYVRTVDAVRVELSFTDSDFRTSLKPGMVVHDNRADQALKVSQDGVTLEPLVDRKASSLSSIMMRVVGIGLLVGVCLIAFRRNRRPIRQQEP